MAWPFYGLESWPSDRSFIAYRRSKNGNPALGLSQCYKKSMSAFAITSLCFDVITGPIPMTIPVHYNCARESPPLQPVRMGENKQSVSPRERSFTCKVPPQSGRKNDVEVDLRPTGQGFAFDVGTRKNPN